MRREGWHDILLWFVRYLPKPSLLFEWILQRDRFVCDIGGQTEAYEIKHYAYFHKICRCDDACLWDIFGSPSNAAGRVRNISLNASIMGQIHTPCSTLVVRMYWHLNHRTELTPRQNSLLSQIKVAGYRFP